MDCYKCMCDMFMIAILIYHNTWRNYHHDGNHVLLDEGKDEAKRILSSTSPRTHILLAALFSCSTFLCTAYTITLYDTYHVFSICFYHIISTKSWYLVYCRYSINIYWMSSIWQANSQLLVTKQEVKRGSCSWKNIKE